jgi:hypothetical protein
MLGLFQVLREVQFRDDRSVAEQVLGGFKWAGYILGGFLCFIGLLMGPVFLQLGNYWKGIACLTISEPGAYLTAHRWVKVLAGFLAAGAVRGLRSVVSGTIGVGATPIPRSEAALMVAGLVVCSILCLGISKRRVGALERTALVASICSFGVLAMNQGQMGSSLALVVVMTACLAIPWTVDRLRRRSSERTVDG